MPVDSLQKQVGRAPGLLEKRRRTVPVAGVGGRHPPTLLHLMAVLER